MKLITSIAAALMLAVPMTASAGLAGSLDNPKHQAASHKSTHTETRENKLQSSSQLSVGSFGVGELMSNVMQIESPCFSPNKDALGEWVVTNPYTHKDIGFASRDACEQAWTSGQFPVPDHTSKNAAAPW